MNGIPVQVVETGQTFSSFRSAVLATLGREYHGRDYDNFTSGRPVSGFHILPVGEEPDDWFEPPPPPKQGRRRPVYCLDTRVTYESMSDAAYESGVSPTTIYRAIRDKKRRGGYRWEYA